MAARTSCGGTPLHHAARCLSLDALLALSKHGADVNILDRRRETPLHVAARHAGRRRAAEAVDSLLRFGADETISSARGNTAANVKRSRPKRFLPWDFERVLRLLANAPADRAWRRRGYLVLCRSYPDRIRLMQETSSAASSGVVRRNGGGAKLPTTEASGCIGPMGGGVVDVGAGRGWSSVVQMVLGLREEGVFRTIVGYL